MKPTLVRCARSFATFVCLILIVTSAPRAHAGLTLDLQLDRLGFNGDYYYGCSPYLNTNTLAPQLSPGTYRIESPFQPTNGFNQSYVLTTNGSFFQTGGGGNLYNDTDFPEFIKNITNGFWSIYVTNTVTTNVYRFKITTTLNSNSTARVQVTFPTNNATQITNHPNFNWQGPVPWAGNLVVDVSNLDTNGDYNFLDAASLTTSATNWTSGVTLPDGTNRLFVSYSSNATAIVVSSTPTNSAGQVIAGWVSNANIRSYAFSEFSVVTPGAAGGGHTNIAHYRFDLGNAIEHDSSPNGNDFNCGSSWNSPWHIQTTPAAAGSRAMEFFGGSSICLDTTDAAFTNVTTVLAETFSVSLWIKTTVDNGSSDTDDAVDGSTVLWGYNDQYSGTNGVIPLSITGTKAAFYTGDQLGGGATLHSTHDVNDNIYHHIVVTRDRATGQKKIYVDGTLDNTGTGSTNRLNGNDYYFSLGGTSISSYEGLVDDLQIYSGVLTAPEVAYLHSNPGSTVANTTGGSGPTNDFEVSFRCTITRAQNPGAGDVFYCFPGFTSLNLPPNTTNEVHSPNDAFSGSLSGSGTITMYSLSDVINEITNGFWTIYLNRYATNEHQFTFRVAAAGFDSNSLKRVNILSPTNGSTGVTTLPAYSWNGPTNFSSLFVGIIYTNYFADTTNLPPASTNWTSSTPLNPGTNSLYINYDFSGITNLTFTTPVDNSSTPIFNWSVNNITLDSYARADFTVTAGPVPVQLLSPQRIGTNFQSQFLSQTGRTNTVQSRTNLVLGLWVNRTNIIGDGTVKIFVLPVSSGSKAEFYRISSQ